MSDEEEQDTTIDLDVDATDGSDSPVLHLRVAAEGVTNSPSWDPANNGSAGFNPHANPKIPETLQEDVQVDEEDEGAVGSLSGWMVSSCDIVPSSARNYCARFVSEGVGSVRRLAKKLQTDPNFLSSCHVRSDDALEIHEALDRGNYFLNTKAVTMRPNLSSNREFPSSNSLADAEKQEYLDDIAEANAVAALTLPEAGHSSSASTAVDVTSGVVSGSRDSAALSIADEGGNGIQSQSQIDAATLFRRAAGRTSHRSRYETREKLAEQVSESTALLDRLKMAIEAKMDVAVSGELLTLCRFVSDGSNSSGASNPSGNSNANLGSLRQRAMFKAEAAAVVLQALAGFGGVSGPCERALWAIAVLCRHSDENKNSVSYENAKAFGQAGACELVTQVLSLKSSVSGSGADDVRTVEAAFDAMRSLCCLESNRQLLTNCNACEAVGRCLSLPAYSANPDLCAWTCRVLGHLAKHSPERAEKIGVVGACEQMIGVLQRYQSNLTVATEVLWAMRNLCCVRGNRERFITEFAPACVAAVFKTFVANEAFVTEALRALIGLVGPEEDETPEDNHDEEEPEEAKVPVITVFAIVESGCVSLAVKAIKRSPESEELAALAFQLFYRVAGQLTLVPRLVSGDVLVNLSATFERHAGFEPLAEWGLRTVSRMCQLDGISKNMRNAGLCEMAVATVTTQAISRTIAMHGCEAIGILASDPANLDRLSTSGACEAAVGAIKRHYDYTSHNANASSEGPPAECVNTVVNACFAVHYLCKTPNNASWMGANGAVEAITAALDKHCSHSVAVAQNATRALGSLAESQQSQSQAQSGNLARVFAAGTCLSVVNALKTWGAVDAEAAEYGCRAIHIFCRDFSSSANVSELGRQSACGLVVSVLQTHLTVPAVVTQACFAVHALAVKCKTDKVHLGNTRKLVSRGAIEVVRASLQRYLSLATTASSNASAAEMGTVIRACAMATAALGRLEENRVKLAQCGAADLVLDALRSEKTAANELVVGKIALVLEVLCQPGQPGAASGSPKSPTSNTNANTNTVETATTTFRDKFCAGSVPEILINAITMHERNKEVVSECFRALCVLISNDKARTVLREDRSMKQVVKVVRLHEKDAAVARWGCQLMFLIASLGHTPQDDAARTKLGSLKACEAVTAALGRHGWNSDHSHDGGGHGGGHGDDKEQAAAAALLLAQLANPLAAPVHVCEWGCKLVAALSMHEPNLAGISRLTNSETCQAVVHSLDYNCDHAAAAEWGCIALKAIAGTEPNRAKLGGLGACNAVHKVFARHASVVPQNPDTVVCELPTSGAAGNHDGPAPKQGGWVPSIVRWACEVVHALCTDSGNKALFGVVGVGEDLVTALSVHCELALPATSVSGSDSQNQNHNPASSSSASTGTSGPQSHTLVGLALCRALAAVCRNNADNAARCGTAGACEAVSRAIRAHPLHVQFAEHWCAAVAALSQGSAVNQNALGRFSVCEALATCLGTHRTTEAVVLQCARAIRGVCTGHAENVARLTATHDLNLNVPSKALAALKQHMHIEGIAEQCGWILAHIVEPSPQGSSLDHPSIYVVSGNWDLLASAVQTHCGTNTPGAARFLCAAASTFAHKGRLAHVPLCDAVSLALQRHGAVQSASSGRVLPQVLATVGALARANVANSARLAAKGGVCELLDVILQWLPDANMDSELSLQVTVGVYKAVTGLCTNDSVGGIGSTTVPNRANQDRFNALGSHAATASVNSSSSSTVSSNNNRENGFCKALVSSIFNDLESESVAKFGCIAVTALACKHKELQLKLSKFGHFAADILQTYRSGHAHAEIAEECCKTVSALAHMNITNRNRLVQGSADLCTELPRVIANFNEDGQVTDWAVRAIANLAANNPNNQSALGSAGCCEVLVQLTRKLADRPNAGSQGLPTVPPQTLQGMRVLKWTAWALANLVQMSSTSLKAAQASQSSQPQSSQWGLGLPGNMGMNLNVNMNMNMAMHIDLKPQVANVVRIANSGGTEALASALLRYGTVSVSESDANGVYVNTLKSELVQWLSRALANVLLKNRADSLARLGANWAPTELVASGIDGLGQLLDGLAEEYQKLQVVSVVEWVNVARDALAGQQQQQ